MAKAGRPSEFTEELGQQIVDAFWNGEHRSLASILRLDGAPPRRTIYRWMKVHPEFGEALREARIATGELYADDNDQIVKDVLKGKIEPSAASVAINWNKHQAAIADPRNYAAKTQIDTTNTSQVTTEYIHRISLEGFSEEERDAIEIALGGKLLTGPDADTSSTGQD